MRGTPWVQVAVAVVAVAGCSGGGSDALPRPRVTDPAQIAREVCQISVELAVRGQFLELHEPTGDQRADDLLEKVLYDYGPKSVQFLTANEVYQAPSRLLDNADGPCEPSSDVSISASVDTTIRSKQYVYCLLRS